ncbi:MAG TPA: hypothetical protein VNH15_03070 [Elusimicrobiota bacterium]|nr:hypothetical protein [Elusimicrobiota bacterium]
MRGRKIFWPDGRLSLLLAAASAAFLAFALAGLAWRRLSPDEALLIVLLCAYSVFWHLSGRVVVDGDYVEGFLDPQSYMRRGASVPLASAPLRIKIPLRDAAVYSETAPSPSDRPRVKIKNLREPKFPKIAARFLSEREARKLQAEIEERQRALLASGAAPAGAAQA